MKKKLLAIAIGSVFAGSMAVAQADDTTLYGQIDVSIDAYDQDGGDDDVNMHSNTSAFGVKGSEDLGNGLSAIFQMEFQVDVTGASTGAETGTTGVTGRDTWLGVKGDFGTLRLGTISTSYKSHGAMVDPIYRTSLEGRSWGLQSSLHSGSGTSGQGRATHTIRFDTADYSGFMATATYTLDNDKTDAEDNDSYGVGAQYKNGPILVYGDYLTNDNGDEDEAYKVGGSYTTDTFGLYAQYEVDKGLISSLAPGNTNDDADVWFIGGSFTMGSTMLYAAYGQGDDDSAAGDTSYDAWELAVKHNMSKRTMLYAGYVQVSPDVANSDESQFSLGMRHKF